jgi:hypothetical protein
MRRCVDPEITDVSEERRLTQPPVDAGSPLADFSTLKMEAIRSSETFVNHDIHSATSQKTTSSK